MNEDEAIRHAADAFFGRGAPAPLQPRAANPAPAAPAGIGYWTGEKYPGGLGPAREWIVDYWTLRYRSAELFRTNLYARGLIRRLVQNEINTGLQLEARPEERILGLDEDALADWAETIENRFSLWAGDARLCDFAEQKTFGALQAQARLEALVSGDVLVVLRQDPRMGTPRVQLIDGAAVQTPLKSPRGGNEIRHGVEIDAQGRHIAYHMVQKDGTSRRLPAVGEKSGRRLAWLVYGTDKRLEDVRGEPVLSLVVQSLKELDRFRDSVQRKAAIGAILAMFIKKETATIPGKSFGMAGIRRGVDTAVDSTGVERDYNIREYLPGVVLDELQPGETPHAFTNTAVTEDYARFEEAILAGIAWGNGIPPEILKLGFSSNYSASQAALSEYKQTLNVIRTDFGNDFCSRVYVEWLVSEAANRKIDNSAAIVEARRDWRRYDIFAAWTTSDWSGHVKPAVDLLKMVKGYSGMIAQGLITRDRAAREMTGTKFSKNVQQLERENAMLAESQIPLRMLDTIGTDSTSINEDESDTAGDVDQEDGTDVDTGDESANANVVRLQPRRK